MSAYRRQRRGLPPRPTWGSRLLTQVVGPIRFRAHSKEVVNPLGESARVLAVLKPAFQRADRQGLAVGEPVQRREPRVVPVVQLLPVDPFAPHRRPRVSNAIM